MPWFPWHQLLPHRNNRKNEVLWPFTPSGTIQKPLSIAPIPTLRLGASGKMNICPSITTMHGLCNFIHVWRAYCPGAPSLGHLHSSLGTIRKRHVHRFFFRLFMICSPLRLRRSLALRNLKIKWYARERTVLCADKWRPSWRILIENEDGTALTPR
jgi:hypothetical protein